MVRRRYRYVASVLVFAVVLAACVARPPQAKSTFQQPRFDCTLLTQPQAEWLLQQNPSLETAKNLIAESYDVALEQIESDTYALGYSNFDRALRWETVDVPYVARFQDDKLANVQAYVLGEKSRITMGNILNCLGTPVFLRQAPLIMKLTD
jgi:hypothetical protein